jgi:ribosome-associated protein YbcJ (S4-like RNA binding protein)
MAPARSGQAKKPILSANAPKKAGNPEETRGCRIYISYSVCYNDSEPLIERS